MANDLECRKCKWFRWIPGCIALSVVVPCSEMTKPKGQPCIDFEPRDTPLLADELADELSKAIEVVAMYAPNHPVRDSGNQALDRYLRDPGQAKGFRARSQGEQEESDVPLAAGESDPLAIIDDRRAARSLGDASDE